MESGILSPNTHGPFSLFLLCLFCSGRANNWAFGYFGGGENVKSSGSNGDVEAIMETYRRMVESVYRYDGVLMIHSLAGGTGSGLGSR